MSSHLSRRQMLGASAAAVGVGLVPTATVTAQDAPKAAPSPTDSRFCLNTATLRGHRIGLVEEIEVVAKAGYQAVEPWIGEITRYRDTGGDLKDLGKRLADLGLAVPSVIAFPNWIVDDDAKRAAGLEQAKRDMDVVLQIGGQGMAAPAAGENNNVEPDLLKAAERYRAILDVGQAVGVVPQLEMWGASRHTGRLGRAAFIAIESGHPQACLLPDVFHLYKGGSDFAGLRLLSALAVHVLHINDYPADPPRDRANDSHRLYPGDGIAPLPAILRHLRAAGSRCYLSLELFNKDVWKLDAPTAARTGLDKMRAVVAKSA